MANAEMKVETQVELESLHEQLRVRKEKQYRLPDKVQASEMAAMENELVRAKVDALNTDAHNMQLCDTPAKLVAELQEKDGPVD